MTDAPVEAWAQHLDERWREEMRPFLEAHRAELPFPEDIAEHHGFGALHPERPFPSERFPAPDRWLWESEDVDQPDEALHDGWLPLHDFGCGEYDVLVLTGPEAGRVWTLTDVGVGRLAEGYDRTPLRWVEEYNVPPPPRPHHVAHGGPGEAPRRPARMIRACRDDERDAILAIVNAAAAAYRGVIPAERWHERYMTRAELDAEIAAGVTFWGHALRTAPGPVLVGTWAAAEWAIRFYERHGFGRESPARTAELLRAHWDIPDRQVETSVVLRRDSSVAR